MPVFRPPVNRDSVTITNAAITGSSNRQQSGLVAPGPPALVDAYVLEPGTAGNNVSTPHATVMNTVTDLTVIVYALLDDWTPSADQTIVSKHTSAAAGSWSLQVTSPSGALRFGADVSGVFGSAATTVTVQGVTGVVDGRGVWLKAERTNSNGQVDFFYSNDPPSTAPSAVTWTTLQLNRAGPSLALDDSPTVDVHVGGHNAGATAPMAGKVFRSTAYKGLGVAGTQMFDMRPADWTSGTTWVSSATGETWTLNGTASIVPDPNSVTGSAADTLQAATSLASGAHGVTGSGTPTLGAATGTSSGIAQVTGTVNVSLGNAASAAAGALGVAGTIARTLGNATSVASGAHGVAGSSAPSLGTATSAGVGYAQVTGTSARSLSPAVSAGTGGVGVAGSVAASLATATGSAQGTQTVVGTASPTLGAATATASGTFTPASVSGTVAATLGAAAGAAAGTALVTGTLFRTLGTATGAASGSAFPPSTNGPVIATLANATGSAAGAVGVSGTVGRSLGNATATASGTHAQPVSGASSTTLSPAFSTGIGRVAVTGSVAATLGNATSVASGTGPPSAPSSSTGTGPAPKFPNFEPSTRHDQRLTVSARTALRVEYDRVVTVELVCAADTWAEIDPDQVTDLQTAMAGGSRAAIVSNRRLNPATVLLAIA